jgi:hypothetical protein
VILKLLSYNIRFGGLRREDALADVIKTVAPDLVVFQEATHPSVIERLSKATGLSFWAARESHSIGYISRNEMAYHEWHYPAGARHSFLELVPANTSVRIFGLHLSARFSKWDESRRTREIRSLLKGIERHQEGFHVLVGDFNTLAPGEALELARLPTWIRALIWISGRKLQRETIQIFIKTTRVTRFPLGILTFVLIMCSCQKLFRIDSSHATWSWNLQKLSRQHQIIVRCWRN